MLRKFLLSVFAISVFSSHIYADSECNGENGGSCENVPSWQAPDIVLDNNANSTILDAEWSGGANMDNNYQSPSGFNLQKNDSSMSLSMEEVGTDDGVSILSVSAPVDPYADMEIIDDTNIYKDLYYASSENMNMEIEPVFKSKCKKKNKYCVSKYDKQAIRYNAEPILEAWNKDARDLDIVDDNTVRQWAVTQGETLRIVLEDWAKVAGWDVVWNTSREYPIQASAMFNGRFLDVASSLVRNFSRAHPAPYAKFYKGNKIIVVQTVGGLDD